MFSRVTQRCALASAVLAAAAFALALSGCSDSSTPPSPASGDKGSEFVAGELQPGGSAFVLRRVDTPVPGYAPIRVALLGSNLQLDPVAETVSIDVALRNEGPEPLHAPATIWLSEFVPPAVTVLNADFHEGPPDTNPVAGPPPTPPRWGFDYSGLLGGDPVLAPDETSESRTWRFHVPGLTGFAFRARPEFGMVPDLPRIAGRVFRDLNRDGVMQPDEPPFLAGPIHATGPDGYEMTAIPDRSGHYALPVTLPGLYTLTLYPLRDYSRDDMHDDDDGDGDDDDHPYVRPIFTTPNPLEVLLAPGPDGWPQSFLDANFGVFVEYGGWLPPVLLTTVPLDSLESSHYQFLNGVLWGRALRLRVGYSGCQPEHPLALYAAPGAQMSPFPHFDLVLVHDDLGEMCEAWWEREAGFDLTPLRWFGGAYTSLPIYLHLRDFQGVVHDFVWELPDRDDDD